LTALNRMVPRKTRKQKKQKGGFRRVKVTIGDSVKEAKLYGIDQRTGKYMILLDGKLVSVEQAAVEFLNEGSKGALNKTCATCGLNPQRLTERNLLTQRSESLKRAKDGLHVPQDAFTIQPLETPILTYGLATCTALSMVIGKQRFLAHISADTDVMPMILAIVNTIKSEKARPTDVRVWTGLGGSSNNANVLKNSPTFFSLENVQRILSVLHIESVTLEDTCFAEVVGL